MHGTEIQGDAHPKTKALLTICARSLISNKYHLGRILIEQHKCGRGPSIQSLQCLTRIISHSSQCLTERKLIQATLKMLPYTVPLMPEIATRTVSASFASSTGIATPVEPSSM